MEFTHNFLRSPSGSENVYQTTASSPFTDTGAAGTSGSIQTSDQTARIGVGTSTPTANLNVVGTTTLQTPVNSTTAFQVQNASGGSVLTTDTTTNSLTVNQGNLTVTNVGTAGSTTYSYYIVAHNVNGKTVPGPVGTTTTGNATLSTTNYNTISWTAVANATCYDVLKTNTTTSLATCITGTSVNDTGQSTTAYTPVTTNTTGGNLTVNGYSTFKPTTDSTTAFMIQNASGTSVLTADTVDRYIGINNASPNAALDVVASSPTFFDGFESGSLPPFTSVGADSVSITNSNPYAGLYSALLPSTGSTTSDMRLTKTLSASSKISFYGISSNSSFGECDFYVNG